MLYGGEFSQGTIDGIRHVGWMALLEAALRTATQETWDQPLR